MVRVEPTVTREGAITLVRQFAPTDRVTRSPAGRRCALAVDDGAWVIDLDEARVVTWIPLPSGGRCEAMTDEDTLVALDPSGTLRAFALPDGGCVAELPLPGAWALAGHTPETLLLWGEAVLRVDYDGRVRCPSGATLCHAVDLRSGRRVAAVDGERFAAALSTFVDELARLPTSAEELVPWGVLSPDGDRVALSFETPARQPRQWSVGDLDEASWSHAFTFDLQAPEDTLARWAAPLEGWTLGWRSPDTLAGYLGVATGPPPYRAMPFARRRVHRDGRVITWRPDDTDLLLAPGASANGLDLDDGRFVAWVASARAAHAFLWNPTTGASEALDLLAGLDRAALHPGAPVGVGCSTDGAFVLALPRPDGGATITRDGIPTAETPARLGPPDQLRVDGPCVELSWTPQPPAPWHRGFIR